MFSFLPCQTLKYQWFLIKLIKDKDKEKHINFIRKPLYFYCLASERESDIRIPQQENEFVNVRLSLTHCSLSN